MSGGWLAIGAVAALAAVATSRRGSAAQRFVYHITYDILDPEEVEVVERGFVIDGWPVEMPEEIHGEAARRWFLENRVDQVLDRADDDDVWEAIRIDPAVTPVPDWVRAAISFAERAYDAGMGSDGNEGRWYGEPDQDIRSGQVRTETYHLASQEYKTLAGVERIDWPLEATDFVNVLIGLKQRWPPANRKRRDLDDRLNKLLAKVLDRPVGQVVEERRG